MSNLDSFTFLVYISNDIVYSITVSETFYLEVLLKKYCINVKFVFHLISVNHLGLAYKKTILPQLTVNNHFICHFLFTHE